MKLNICYSEHCVPVKILSFWLIWYWHSSWTNCQIFGWEGYWRHFARSWNCDIFVYLMKHCDSINTMDVFTFSQEEQIKIFITQDISQSNQLRYLWSIFKYLMNCYSVRYFDVSLSLHFFIVLRDSFDPHVKGVCLSESTMILWRVRTSQYISLDMQLWNVGYQWNISYSWLLWDIRFWTIISPNKHWQILGQNMSWNIY